MSLVDELLVSIPEERRLRGRYDERRGYTVDAGGQPLVVSETHEITEVSAERDEPSWPESEPVDDDLRIETVRTFVERETDDVSGLAMRAYLMRTETAIGREQPDRDAW